MQTTADTHSQLSERVASEIRAEMARRNISQSTLAAELGKDQAWLSRRLARRSGISMSLDDLERIASSLGLDAGQLIERALPKAITA